MILSSKKSKRSHLFFREVDLNGYGIADLLLFETTKVKKGCKDELGGYITTFEIKIKDWRKAVKQAIRYRYYSNRVVVVLPIENIKNALLQLNIYKGFNIGLWAFDKKNNEILKFYTPRYHKPLNYIAKERAISLIYEKFKVLPVVKTSK